MFCLNPSVTKSLQILFPSIFWKRPVVLDIRARSVCIPCGDRTEIFMRCRAARREIEISVRDGSVQDHQNFGRGSVDFVEHEHAAFRERFEKLRFVVAPVRVDEARQLVFLRTAFKK